VLVPVLIGCTVAICVVIGHMLYGLIRLYRDA
jgi:hypothetical protein